MKAVPKRAGRVASPPARLATHPCAATLAAFLCAALLAACAGGGHGGAISASEYAGFTNPAEVAITGYTGDAMEPFISKDGRYLFFNNRNDPTINTDLFYAARVDDRTFAFLGAVPNVNSPALDAVASLDTLGNFYFVSTRSYMTTLSSVYSGHFSAGGVADIGLVPGISLQKAGWVNFDAEISADGQTLWFDDGQYSSSGVLQAATIVAASLQNGSFARLSNSAVLLSSVNTDGLNYAPDISADGLELFFTRVATSGGAIPSIYRAARADTNSAFGPPELVSAAAGFVEAPSLSADGHLLYFHKQVNGGFAIFCVQR